MSNNSVLFITSLITEKEILEKFINSSTFPFVYNVDFPKIQKIKNTYLNSDTSLNTMVDLSQNDLSIIPYINMYSFEYEENPLNGIYINVGFIENISSIFTSDVDLDNNQKYLKFLQYLNGESCEINKYMVHFIDENNNNIKNIYKCETDNLNIVNWNTYYKNIVNNSSTETINIYLRIHNEYYTNLL